MISSNSGSFPLSVSSTNDAGLTMTLSENQSTVPVGGQVIYTMTITNNTPKAIAYAPIINGSTVVSDVGGEIVVDDPNGKVVYPPQAAIPQFVAIGTQITIAPGQSVSGSATVSGVFTAPGRYAASATFLYNTPSGGGTQSAAPLDVDVY
jgi:hypothetical protein